MSIDLTPFGFTPTENIAYGALIDQGPLSGYALAKFLNLARANAYQALNGLVKKEAAVAIDERPVRYRPVRPEALLARIIEIEAAKIDELERQVAEIPDASGPALVAINSLRSLVDIALRTAGRAAGAVSCVAPADFAVRLNPAWRKRVAQGQESLLWLTDRDEPSLAVPATRCPVDGAGGWYTDSPFLLLADDAAVVATVSDAQATGHWTSDRALVGTARAAVSALTGGA